MAKAHKPHSGSKAFYPKKRAARITPSFKTFPQLQEQTAKPLNFLCYKAGMLHLIAKDAAPRTTTAGQNIVVPATVLECPPLKVYGVRAYTKDAYGFHVLTDIFAEKIDKHLQRKIKNFKRKVSKKKKESAETEKPDLSKLEKMKDEIAMIRLLVHTQPALCGFGKKKPEITEIALSGNVAAQLEFAKSKLGGEIKIDEVFKEQQFVDVKAVDKGKGFQGVVKRFGVKTHRPKAKKARVVGSIGPWHPATVMWTVPRAGQLGFQTRTELNKRIIMIGNDPTKINPSAGFTNYGVVKNSFILLAGSVPGVPKRAIALRFNIRKANENQFKLAEISFISTVSNQTKTKPKKQDKEKEDVKKAKKTGEFIKENKEKPEKESTKTKEKNNEK